MSITLSEQLSHNDNSMPPGFRVHVRDKEDEDDLGELGIEWDGETKITVEVDDSKDGEVGLHLKRPDHWGQDVRTEEEQQPEFQLAAQTALDMVMADQTVNLIELPLVSGARGSAGLELAYPNTWQRSVKIDRHEGWAKGKSADFRELVRDGATISLQFERSQHLRLVHGLGQVTAGP